MSVALCERVIRSWILNQSDLNLTCAHFQRAGKQVPPVPTFKGLGSRFLLCPLSKGSGSRFLLCSHGCRQVTASRGTRERDKEKIRVQLSYRCLSGFNEAEIEGSSWAW